LFDRIKALSTDEDIEVTVALPPSNNDSVMGVKQVVLVASGKGGVGKSTTTVHLARALSASGLKVGVLDADIYGPSVPIMFGVAEGTRPGLTDTKLFTPIVCDGVQTMSIGFLTTEKTPAVWRGPMASGALLQMIQNTEWQDVDILLIDMPPGTGDIQLSIAQKVNVSGAVIVTTPQDLALSDARKAVEMFRKVDIPILGLVENMSTHICGECGHEEAIFGSEGGVTMAREYEVELLGRLPLDITIRKATDEGASLSDFAGTQPTARYAAMAEALTKAMMNLKNINVTPIISMS
jgi:ATP-binding protein involved in chromosome partitioning